LYNISVAAKQKTTQGRRSHTAVSSYGFFFPAHFTIDF